MKKALLIMLLSFSTILFTGCELDTISHEKDEMINIEFVYNDEVYVEKAPKGSKLEIDALSFIENKNDIMLFYGKNYENKYNNEILNEDIKMLICDFNGSKKIGKFYTLKEAYDKNYITKNDLVDIKKNYINSKNINLMLDKIIELMIINDRLIALRETQKEATMEDITVFGYYGNYNNVYVIRLCDVFSNYPAVIEEFKIDDIFFEYSGPAFLAWINEE